MKQNKSMFPFCIYLITAVVIAFSVLSDLRWAVWGGPISSGHFTALVGAIILLVASFLALFRPRVSTILGIIGTIAIWPFILPMVYLTDPRFVATPYAVLLSLWVGITSLYSLTALIIYRSPRLYTNTQFIFPEFVGKLSRILAVSVAVLICAFTSIAYLHVPTPRQIWSEDLPSDLIVYFKEEATYDEINEFIMTFVGVPKPEQGPTAWEMSPEISSIASVIGVGGHQAYAINLWPNVSKTARQGVIERIWQSPIVFAVLENAPPSGVLVLPTPSK